MIEINRQPSRRELEWFGVLFALFFGIVGSLAYWKFGAPRAAAWIWAVAAGVTGVYYAFPAVRRPVYLAWMVAAFPIGWVLSHAILAVVYYGVLTPIGLALRLRKNPPFERRMDPGASSYWTERKPEVETSRYFRQY